MSLFHSMWTVLLLFVFLGIVVWAWSGQQKQKFHQAARLPLEDDGGEAADYKSGGDTHG